jgi:metal-sulfur cluster biosynthetic enzyme
MAGWVRTAIVVNTTTAHVNLTTKRACQTDATRLIVVLLHVVSTLWATGTPLASGLAWVCVARPTGSIMDTAHPTARPASELSLGRTDAHSEALWTPIQLEIRNALMSVPDPEIGLSIVDLGLVRDIEVLGDNARVGLLVTSPACPMGESLVLDAEAAIRDRLPQLASVVVTLLLGEPWGPHRMSTSAKRALGWTR